MGNNQKSDTRLSPLDEFGHCVSGYAVEFNLEGVACRSWSVEERREAETLQNLIEQNEGVSGAEVISDG